MKWGGAVLLHMWKSGKVAQRHLVNEMEDVMRGADAAWGDHCYGAESHRRDQSGEIGRAA